MFNKIKEYSGLVAVIVIIIVLLIPSTSVKKLGNNTASNYMVNGVEVISTNGVIDGLYGGSSGTLAITTTTSLTATQSALYDAYNITTSTAAITITLPTAASTTALNLTQDGTWDVDYFQLAAGNNFNVTFATSTGDVFSYNGTSTAGGLTMATSATGSFWKLEAVRMGSSIYYTLTNNGVGH